MSLTYVTLEIDTKLYRPSCIHNVSDCYVVILTEVCKCGNIDVLREEDNLTESLLSITD